MHTILPLQIGLCECAQPLVYFEEYGDKQVTLAYYMWLIRGGGATILVDTGFTGAQAHAFMPAMRQAPAEAPLAQLRRCGVDPGVIDLVIVTHAHFDHLSPLLFSYTNARIIMQKKELIYSTIPPHPWFKRYVVGEVLLKLVENYPGRLELVEGDTEVWPGIQVVWTGGHTPGHQSVVVQTEQGKVAIAGDVAFTYRNLAEDIPIGLATSIEECFAAMARLRRAADIVLPGHDPLVLSRYGNG